MSSGGVSLDHKMDFVYIKKVPGERLCVMVTGKPSDTLVFNNAYEFDEGCELLFLRLVRTDTKGFGAS